VRFTKLTAIQNRREKNKVDLMQELIESGSDTTATIRCPRCLGQMEKRVRTIGKASFSVDACTRCSVLWLDAGELAKLQVIHEYSPKGQQQQALRDRLNNMTPAEKQAFEDRIANLPERTPCEFPSRNWWDPHDIDFWLTWLTISLPFLLAIG